MTRPYCYTCKQYCYDDECINKQHRVYDGFRQLKKYVCRTGIHSFDTEEELKEHNKRSRFRRERP